jgi:hypothetical protein
MKFGAHLRYTKYKSGALSPGPDIEADIADIKGAWSPDPLLSPGPNLCVCLCVCACVSCVFFFLCIVCVLCVCVSFMFCACACVLA